MTASYAGPHMAVPLTRCFCLTCRHQHIGTSALSPALDPALIKTEPTTIGISPKR
jgi:hypothetical protein